MARTLILGGTRNLGHMTALSLLEAGHDVAVLNRGHTRDDLPPGVERLRGDRGDDSSIREAIGRRTFDLVLDNTTYTKADARQVAALFHERAGRYVFISTGQVYLVRQNLPRPFREADYDGEITPEPPHDSADHSSWLYGIDKRLAEEVLGEAASRGFPLTTLRLPMVASERDYYGRIQGYIARFDDNAPLLVPDEKGLPLRHVYVRDVARLVTKLIGVDQGRGSFNVSYGRSMSLAALLDLLREITGSRSDVLRVKRDILEVEELLPDCSPFSGEWMSELDNAESVEELGATYASPEEYLPSIVEDFRSRWRPAGMSPASYAQRQQEAAFIARAGK